ncbi:hypothetical protein AOT82_1262 [Psychrobacter sp. AntiMn-1]|nr:hypothetical protein AOT82_1262 [Psychrobacter sp. AntiMn-1]
MFFVLSFADWRKLGYDEHHFYYSFLYNLSAYKGCPVVISRSLTLQSLER